MSKQLDDVLRELADIKREIAEIRKGTVVVPQPYPVPYAVPVYPYAPYPYTFPYPPHPGYRLVPSDYPRPVPYWLATVTSGAYTVGYVTSGDAGSVQI